MELRRHHALATVALLLALAAGCGPGFRTRGRTLADGRQPFDTVDPSGTWIVDGNLPWGSGHTLEVVGEAGVYYVTRRDAGGRPIAFGVGIAEAGHFFVGYSGSLENCQIGVYQVGQPDPEGHTNIEGVWADGRSHDLGTEEWQGVGTPDPFAGIFRSYGTNPNGHDGYRLRVAVETTNIPDLYAVRWGSGRQEFIGTALRVGDRLAIAAVLTFQDSFADVMWSRRGYALGAYDVVSGTGSAVFRASADDVPLVGTEQIRRP